MVSVRIKYIRIKECIPALEQNAWKPISDLGHINTGAGLIFLNRQIEIFYLK